MQVQDADGRPIANPTVGFQNGANVDVTWQSGDASGKAIVDVDTRSPRYVYLLARAAGFAPMRAFWGSRDGKPADELPSEFTFRMEEATSVGGTVLDEQGKGIAEAIVRFSAAVRRSADASRAQASFFQEVYTTDKEGHWTCDKRPQIIMGTVVDRTTKLPISEFVIERAFEGMTGYPDGLSWGDPTRSANGKYRKTVNMPPSNGSYTYRAIAAGYEVSTSKSISFREGDTTIVNFELTPK